MDSFRQGSCTQCKNSFRVPATFTANKAKCPKCGGVVEIGDTQSAAAARKTPESSSETPRPVPASVPTPKPAQAETPAPKPVAAAPVTPKPAIAKPVTKPVAEVASAPKSPAVKSSTAAAAPSVRTAATDAARKVKGGTAGKSAKSDGGTKERRHAREPKKKSMVPAFIGVFGVLVLGVAAYWYLAMYMPKQNETQAKAKAEADAAKAAAAVASKPAETNPAAASGSPSDSSDTTQKPAQTPAQTPTESSQPVADATPTPTEEPKKVEKEVVDDIDLMALAVQDKLADTSDEDWTTIQELAAVFTDPDAGAKGNRARGKLKEYGKAAFPALLNRMRTLNLASEEGMRNGDVIQRLLMDICSGNNFGWYYKTEPKEVVLNKKVVRLWFVSFEQARDNEAAWNKLAKIAKPAGDGEAAGDGKKPVLDDF